MSKSEDYLDGLLHSMDAKKQTWDDDETDLGIGGGDSLDQKFLDDFERELMSELDEDDFLREFERELNGGAAPQEHVSDDAASVPDTFGNADGLDDFDGGEQARDSFFDNLDGIVNSVKENMEDASQTFEQDDDSDFMIDTIGDMPEQADSDFMDLLQTDDGFSDDQVMTQPEDDLESFLQDDSEGSFLDDDFMQGDDGMELSLDDFGDTGVTDMAEQTEEKEEKKEKKPGFLQKLSRLLFGESDEPEEAEDGKKKAAKVPDIEDISDESIQLLQQLGDGISAEGAATKPEPEPEPKKEKKEKKEKKKKKGKKKKGENSDLDEDSEDSGGKKPKKPKKPKKEKPKKEKPPKEPDNSPPLPKKPVILVFVMVASMLALVLIGTNLVGYSNSISLAKKEYALGNYAQALQEISGMEIKKEDTELYQKCSIMAGAAGEYSAYRSFMETGIYDMALDTLVRTVGRCEKYSSDAVTYGCENELAKVREQAVASLAGFGITEERALQLYENEDRNAYSTELNQILADAGLLREKE